jgi:arylsulfatase A-like enzyme
MGDKRSAYEESMRVPMLVRYPKQLANGKVSDELILNIDLAPSFLDLAGVEIPKEIQGMSWAPLLSDSNAPFRTAFFYEYFFENKFAETPTVLALRTKTHKLIKYPGHEDWTELYDLNIDPFETKNLVSSPEHRSLLFTMEKAFEQEKKATGYLVPDYAEKPWPADYIHIKKKQNYPWLNRKEE